MCMYAHACGFLGAGFIFQQLECSERVLQYVTSSTCLPLFSLSDRGLSHQLHLLHQLLMHRHVPGIIVCFSQNLLHCSQVKLILRPGTFRYLDLHKKTTLTTQNDLVALVLLVPRVLLNLLRTDRREDWSWLDPSLSSLLWEK